MMRQPAIEEVISFLQERNPKGLEKLQHDNIDSKFSDILKLGQTLGHDEEGLNLEELKLRAQVCYMATSTIVNDSLKSMLSIKKKIKSTNTIRLIGQIITAVSGASILTTISKSSQPVMYCIGSITLIASLIPIIVDYRQRGLNGKPLDVSYENIGKLKTEAQNSLTELNFFIENGFNSDKVYSIILNCNQLCSDIINEVDSTF